MANLGFELESQGYLSLNKFVDYLRDEHPQAYVSYPTARKLVKEGKIRGTKVGKQFRINIDEVRRWVAEGNWERTLASPYSTTY